MPTTSVPLSITYCMSDSDDVEAAEEDFDDAEDAEDAEDDDFEADELLEELPHAANESAIAPTRESANTLFFIISAPR